MRKCRCGSLNTATERRPNGDTKCLSCGYKAPTREWEIERGAVSASVTLKLTSPWRLVRVPATCGAVNVDANGAPA